MHRVFSKQRTACGKDLPRAEFPKSQWDDARRGDRNFFLRCTTCHTCQKPKAPKAFSTTARRCIESSHKEEAWECDGCKERKGAADCSKNILDHAKWHGRRRVCLECQEKAARRVTWTCTHAPSAVPEGT